MSATDTLETVSPQLESHDSENDGAAQADLGHEHDHDGAEHTHGPAMNPELTRSVDVEIAADEVSAAFRSITKRYSKQARIPGFRAGKVPPTLIRSRFAEQIRQDVVEAVLPSHFRTAIEAQSLQPVSQPQVTEIHLVDGEPLKFKAVFEVMPAIDLTGYRDVKVNRPDTSLTDEEYAEEVERVKDSRSTMEPVTEERALGEGDWAQITFKGLVKGAEGQEATPAEEPIEGADVQVEVGGKNTLPAFSDALRGASVGQELKFEVAYPGDFAEQRLAGKTIAYDVEVKAIKLKVVPEWNDDLAKELGEYDTIAEFEEKLREHLAGGKRQRLEAETKDAILGALAERYSFPVPEALVAQQIDARLERGLRALAQQGMREEDMRRLDFSRLRLAQRDGAINEVKGMLLLDRVADQENVEVSNEEMERELEMLSVQAQEPLETLRTRLAQDGTLVRLREQTRREKAGQLLYERLGA